MQIIFVSNKHSRSRAVRVNSVALALVSLCLLSVPGGLGYYAYQLGIDRSAERLASIKVAELEATVDQQAEQLADAQRQAESTISAMSARLAQLQSRLVRLDALGERLTTVAQLDDGEFNFSEVPAVGGPADNATQNNIDIPNFLDEMDRLSDQIATRDHEMSILSDLMAQKKLQQDLKPQGLPVESGWMSSGYGYRTDPFHGKRSWHGGVDFAGKLGSDVVAVGSGVVTWSGDKYGYGKMVEINHGGGFVSRYAHNQENHVVVGEIVKKGQVIAAMGSSGRSTGPHVHFEVYKHGRPVDPATYVRRVSR